MMVPAATEYPYSSARFYVTGENDPLVTENVYYQDLGNSPEERQKKYEDFLRIDEPYAELINDQLLKY